MVYLHFPSNLTEEELMLQAKYQKLKKKKKAVVALKTARPEPPLTPTGTTGARDAREYARKLLKSGAIGTLGPTGSRTPQAFKRPRAARERRPGAHYTPFSAGTVSAVGSPSPGASPNNSASAPTPGDSTDAKPPRPATSLYDSFVVARDKEERVEPQKTKGGGNTVFVSGHKISEDFLRKHLGQFGTIVNISMEIEKHRGFVTFEKHEIAQRAITEMNGTMISGIQLEVSMARRQPQMERINEASSSSAWSTLAASHSQKGPHRDGRSIVTYDDDLFS